MERGCCPYYHEAIELIGRRWTGAIVAVLMDGGPLRFTDIAHAVPDLSDRLLSQRMKELEARGVVVRDEHRYALTQMGRDLGPALDAVGAWGRRWLTAEAAH